MRSEGMGRVDQQLWLVIRLTLAVLLAAHGWMRFLGGGVVPFGDWLNTQGFAAGFYLAAAITAYEILATLLYAAGKWVWQLSVVFVLIYSCGLVLVHAPFGWFVVGAGRNGMEYSMLLIVTLSCIAYRDYQLNKQRQYSF